MHALPSERLQVARACFFKGSQCLGFLRVTEEGYDQLPSLLRFYWSLQDVKDGLISEAR
jgi:hypothetical protein